MEESANRSVYPEEVRREVQSATLRVTWSDGHLSAYPFAYLRGWCPCAGCQGHGGDKRYIHAPNNDLTSVAVVGKYALNLKWGDGHETGIYTYRYLRELCACDACTADRQAS